ncbi:MAG: zinc ribbon domain-containing protein [Eubacteriales bacterium]|nr:zinc ribbon domain-containing protein [Eubacteriales bacterium]
MKERLCPHCGRRITIDNGAAFCPYCGGALTTLPPDSEDDAVKALLTSADAQTDPRKKHDLLLQAQAEHPGSLAIAEELLFLGHLYERNRHTLDFSVIKSYLLNLYLEPETISAEKRDAMRRELFDHPDLERCLALSTDKAAFMVHYLHRLSIQFIQLFLHGSSKYMRRYFGMGLDSRAPKLLAYPAAKMLSAMRDDPALSEEQRSLLMHVFFDSFSEQVGGEIHWLEETMVEHNVSLP